MTERVDDDPLERWTAAGRWDVEHGLMPMATFHLTPEQRTAYAVGYRGEPLGLNANSFVDELRPA